MKNRLKKLLKIVLIIISIIVFYFLTALIISLIMKGISVITIIGPLVIGYGAYDIFLFIHYAIKDRKNKRPK